MLNLLTPSNPFCKRENITGDFHEWNVTRALDWKLTPSFLGGGAERLQKYKDAFVYYHRRRIVDSANQNKLAPEFLAGVLWTEVGGDPAVLSKLAFIGRSFGLDKPPEMTSFDPGSIQLRNVAQMLGMDAKKMSRFKLFQLAECLVHDAYSIDKVARHLRELVNAYEAEYRRHDPVSNETRYYPQTKLIVQYVGKWYNQGKTPKEKMRSTDYGDLIVERWQRYYHLLFLLELGVPLHANLPGLLNKKK
jgi:hypothetical protein